MFPGPAVNQSAGPPPVAMVTLYDYAGGTTLVYEGWAKSDQGFPGVGSTQNGLLPAVNSFTAANPGVITFASNHGFNWLAGPIVTMNPIIAIAGGTGNWAAANGIWMFQATSATAGTIASVISGSLTSLNTTGFGAVTGTLSVTTKSPRTGSPIWSIKRFVYSGTSALLASGWAQNIPGAGLPSNVPGDPSGLLSGSVATGFIWDNRTLYAYA